jgi:hypothetical protein
VQTIIQWFAKLSALCTVACAPMLAAGPLNAGLVWGQRSRQEQTDENARTVRNQNRVAILGQRAAVPTPMRLLDARGRPVAGAVVAGSFRRDADREPLFTPEDMFAAKTSDERGEALVGLDVSGRLDSAGVYAIRQGRGRPLVGIRKFTREELGKPITITMYPTCRVLFQIDSAGLSGLEKEYNVELTGPRWSRAAHLRLGGSAQDPRPLFTCSVTGKLEFLLPPGRFEIDAHADDVFTPDGRRVIAVAGSHVRMWDALSAKLENAFLRMLSNSSDRLAVSPDGQWLAIIGPTEVDCVDIPPSP